MKEARAVIARLDRIEAMELVGEPPALLLDELELLVPEAARWLEREGPARLPPEPRSSAIDSRWVVARILLAVRGEGIAPETAAKSIR
ncbi:MAG: hypothetical protein WBQ14_01090 [Gaiellaceae bacterium]